MKTEEKLEFDLICGDFNCDNVSPGDRAAGGAGLWREWVAPASHQPGQDQNWAVGTELRQVCTLYFTRQCRTKLNLVTGRAPHSRSARSSQLRACAAQ